MQWTKKGALSLKEKVLLKYITYFATAINTGYVMNINYNLLEV